MNDKYDLTIIGGGPGGYVAAIRALQYGLSVALVEEKDMGGTCLNRGCIPTKSLLHSAQEYQRAKTASRFGVNTGDVTYDFTKMAAQKDAAVKQLKSGVEYLVNSNGGVIYRGRGYIKDKNTIEVGEENKQIIHTEKIIIATGSKPAVPPFISVDNQKILNSDGLLSLTKCPDSVIIIGGGVIGIEFATVFNALDKNVTIIEMMDSILPGIDSEVSSILKKSLEKKGVKIYTGSKVMSISSGEMVMCSFECNQGVMQLEAEIAAVVTGRRPNLDSIGLENVGLETVAGFINVNDKMETKAAGIYAIGDITSRKMLAHIASAQGIVAAENAAGANKTLDCFFSPACVYSEPEIASVGFTEEEAVKNGYSVKTGRFSVSANGKSMIMGERDGMTKIICEAETGKILGAHIISPRATDMISEISVAMKSELTIRDIADTIHPHPTVSEIIMEAAHDIDGKCIHKPKQRTVNKQKQ